MPKNEQLPATVPTNSTLPQAQSSSLVARGLAAIQQSLSVPEKQDAESLFKTGMRYRNDESRTPQNSEQARAYFLAAATLNHAEAQFELCLLLGEYYEWPEAVAWLEKSVSLSFGPAQKYLALGLFDPLIADHLSNPDYDQSQLYRQASAWYEERAKAGDPAVQYDFALMHWRGEATIYSLEEAMRWMKAAAEQDHGFACLRLGEWLLDDKAHHRNTEQHACRRLGDFYLLGHMGGLYALKKGEKFSQLIPPDKNSAVSWYERQIELEKERGSFMGMDSLARLYLSGDHLDQDLARAERLLLEAANAGNLDSQRLLAFEYTSGKRLRKDTTAALHWLRMAEENNRSSKLQDQYQLGYFYEHDNDDSPNYVEAVKWYLKAADQGDYRSQKSLGAIYESGKGVPKDYVQAYKWYRLSVARSYGKPGIREFHTDAIKTRDALAQKMTPSHIAEARQLASDWLDNITSLHPADYELAKEGLAKSAS